MGLPGSVERGTWGAGLVKGYKLSVIISLSI